MTTWIAMGLVALLFVGPLVWRTWRDHLEERALSLQADLQAAVNHALGGESLVAVRVKPGAQSGRGLRAVRLGERARGRVARHAVAHSRRLRPRIQAEPGCRPRRAQARRLIGASLPRCFQSC